MINWLIDVSLRNRFLVIAFFILVAGWGYWALRTTPIVTPGEIVVTEGSFFLRAEALRNAPGG